MQNRATYPWETPPGDYMGQPASQQANGPQAPAYVLARVFQDNQVTLLWGESKRADGYLILRGETPQGLKAIAAVEEASYIDTQAQAGKTYYYSVRAYNDQGQSAAADMASVTLPETPAQAAQPQPQEQHDVPYAGQYQSFSPAGQRASLSPAGKRLRVQRRPPENQPASTSPAYTEPYANVPPAPNGLRAATQGTRFVALQWQAPLPALEYRLYRSETPWCCYGLIAETAETQYLDTVPEAATKYYYFVQAVRDGRSSQPSPMAEALTFPPLPPPETPQNLRANPHGHDCVELRWNPARAAAAYVVYARHDPNEDFAIVGHSLDCGWLHEGLPPDSFFDYRVQAYHDSGASEISGVCTGRSGGTSRGAAPRSQNRSQAPPAPPPMMPQAGGRRFPAFSMNAFNAGMRN